ncbi:cytochrome c biogenesis protein CcsA [Candidatus Methylomirabilis sp.]|uniref:cytochrome c biogenesis protein CcsA n=1 Tax=Candidatus Methylomirabilis sp. TaxID=2032687 RepID=UPI002A65EA25|nr:cytochrome c biogenesis protein CcsA [Candidatus Methylomirabilis sp.]
MIGRSCERALGIVTVIGLVIGLYIAFVYAPADAVQGDVQRLMYLHVPLILVSYLAFFVVFIASILYLWRRRLQHDAIAHSSAEIGVLFTALTIAVGSIWGRPTWGAWWTWDARLTTTAILLLMFLGYLMLRALVDDPSRGATFCAVLGIIGFLDVPIIHMSVVWWRTLHQPASILRPGPSTVAPDMQVALYTNLAAFVLLYGYLLVKRLQVEGARRELFRLQMELLG